MKIHCIIPGRLYQRGEFDKCPPHEVISEFSSLGINIVVGLAGKRGKVPSWVNYFYNKIPDGLIIDEAFLSSLADEVFRFSVERRGAILSHCHAGRNRSGLMSAMLVMRILGVSGEESIELVRRGRPKSLANEEFVKFLLRQQKLPREIENWIAEPIKAKTQCDIFNL
jgi:protein-tyrosine phosphatase